MSIITSLAVFLAGSLVGYCVRDVAPKNTGKFIHQLVANPSQVGALTPCSEYVSDEIVRCLCTPTNKHLNVLEVGSGSGVVTEKIVAALSGKRYRLDLVEINEIFSKILFDTYQHNPQVSVHQADITMWQPTCKYDVIISTLPFNVFDKTTVEKVWELYKCWLKPGGKIVFIELAFFGNLGDYLSVGSAKTERLAKRALIAKYRDKYLENKRCILKNFPPIYVYQLKLDTQS